MKQTAALAALLLCAALTGCAREYTDISAAQAAAAFDLLEFKTGRGILENLIYLGLPAAFRRNKKT